VPARLLPIDLPLLQLLVAVLYPTSGFVARGDEGILSPLKFSLSENCLFVGKFAAKNTKSWNDNLQVKFRVKVKILKTNNLGNLQMSVRKLPLPAILPLLFQPLMSL